MLVKSKKVTAKFISIFLAILMCLSMTPLTSLAAAVCSIQKIYTDKARYNPGDTVNVTVVVSNSSGEDESSTLNLAITHLDASNYSTKESVTVPANSIIKKTFSWQAPAKNYTGYLVSANIDNGNSATTAVDVSSDAKRFPRYGYTDDFRAGESSAKSQSLIDELSQDYHIDMLQYYDWMYRHEQDFPASGADSWNDLFGNTISESTIKQRIAAGHNDNQIAMAYQMANMAREGYEANGVSKEWGAYGSSTNHNISYNPDDISSISKIDQLYFAMEGNPNPILFAMNPANKSWQNFITGQYKSAINTLSFDGIQLDQMGNYWGGKKYDYSGNVLDLGSTFSSLVNSTKSQLTSNDPSKNYVTMNIVNGAIPSSDSYSSKDIINNANTDFDFSEIWDNSPSYNSLKQFIDYQKKINNKAMVLAAYMNQYDNAGTAYQAENAASNGLLTSQDNGTTYVSGFSSGKYIDFTVNAPESGDYTLIFNYTNGNSARATKNIYVDNKKAAIANFDPTRTNVVPASASWTNWSTDSCMTNPKMIYLSAGTHSIRVQQDPENSGEIRLDSMTLGTFNEPSVRLTDSVIAASGASHIEMGTGLSEANSSDGYSSAVMLGSPYYPKAYKAMRSGLRTAMKSYYNFITAYENLLYDTDLTTADGGTQNISIAGESVSGSGEAGKIFFIPKQKGNDYDVLHLINLTSENDTTWRNVTAEPQEKTNLAVKYYIPYNKSVSSVNLASPDSSNASSASLDFKTGTDSTGKYVSFTVPSLKYWDMLYIKWGNESEPAVYEAEDSIKSGVTTGTDHAGYTGTGFVDGFGAVYSSVNFNICVPADGNYVFNFKYANATGAACYRDLILDNNDAGNVSFPNQTDWNTWADSEKSLYLKAGRHTLVVLTPCSNGGYINLDNLSVYSAYEAEDAAMTGTQINTNHPGYTGSGFADGFADKGDKVTFKINTPEDGKYLLNFRYANNTGYTATRHIYVDGQNAGTLSFKNHADWDTWDTAGISADLSGGTHTVCISYDATDDHAINLDNLTVNKIYEAEDAGRTNVSVNTNHPGYTGTGFVDGFAAQGSSVNFKIDAASAGNVMLNFRYANGTGYTATRHIYVDGTNIGTLSFPQMSDWDTWNTAGTSAYLTQGSHTVSISYDSSDDHAINLDSLVLN